MSDRHILTAVAWPYANGPRHIGHVSGFGVPSDVFSRYHRMAGDRVLMVSGTADPIVPYAGGEVSLFGFSKRGRVLSAPASAEAFARLAAASPGPAGARDGAGPGGPGSWPRRRPDAGPGPTGPTRRS